MILQTIELTNVLNNNDSYMCIISRSTKLIGVQLEKKHGKGSKNSSAYFDSRIEIEQESDILIADYSFDECSFFKEDDYMFA